MGKLVSIYCEQITKLRIVLNIENSPIANVVTTDFGTMCRNKECLVLRDWGKMGGCILII